MGGGRTGQGGWSTGVCIGGWFYLTSYLASCSFNAAYLLVKSDSGWWNRGEKGKVLETEKQ